MATREPQASTPPEETETLLGATIAGRYRILSVIARGGMGKVYKAEQSALGRVCAVKILSPHYEGNKDPEFHRRFSLEASTAAKLQHPNTVTIFDYGKCDAHDVYFIAMEFLDGRTLHRVMHDARTLPEARASHIAQQICRSVHEAHRLGVVHRDLKPSNVLLVERGEEEDFVKVLDFGLVKDVTGKGEDLTQTGLFMGSPKYMAPEQVMGGDISPRTDVYSLGVILYEMIAGKVPFDRKAGMSTLIAHVNEAPPPISVRNPSALVSPEMETIVMRCLEKEPEKRFPSMKDLLNSLKRANGDLSETYESLPRARIDYETAMKMGGTAGTDPGSGPKRLSVPPPSFSGTLRSPLIASQTGPFEQPADASGPKSGPSGPSERSGPTGENSDSLSLPHASRSMFAQADRPSTARPYLFAVAVSVISAGTMAVMLSRRSEPSQQARPVESAVPAAAVAVPVSSTGEAPKGPDIRILHIDSDPSGASVSDHGVQVCMATPCEVYWRGAAGKLEHQLSLSKRGFKTTTVTVAPNAETVTAKLDVYGTSDVPGQPVGVGGPAKTEPTASPAPAATTAAPEASKPEPPPAPTTTPVAAVTPAAVTAQPAPTPAPTPEPPPAATPAMHNATDVDTRAARVSCPSPVIPNEARVAKVSGTVVAKCIVTETGAVTGCRIIKSLPFMDGPVLAAFASCKYTPAMSGGKPVASDVPMTVKIVTE